MDTVFILGVCLFFSVLLNLAFTTSLLRRFANAWRITNR